MQLDIVWMRNGVTVWFLALHCPLVIKTHYVPLGCGGQFVSSAVI